jgi:hypothetical protein
VLAGWHGPFDRLAVVVGHVVAVFSLAPALPGGVLDPIGSAVPWVVLAR